MCLTFTVTSNEALTSIVRLGRRVQPPKIIIRVWQPSVLFPVGLAEQIHALLETTGFNNYPTVDSLRNEPSCVAGQLLSDVIYTLEVLDNVSHTQADAEAVPVEWQPILKARVKRDNSGTFDPRETFGEIVKDVHFTRGHGTRLAGQRLDNNSPWVGQLWLSIDSDTEHPLAM